jgi:large subunit ribosomal protein L35
MPKIKSRKAAQKRFRVSKSGKLLRRSSRLRHLLEWKSPRQRRRLKREKLVSDADQTRVRQMLAGGN